MRRYEKWGEYDKEWVGSKAVHDLWPTINYTSWRNFPTFLSCIFWKFYKAESYFSLNTFCCVRCLNIFSSIPHRNGWEERIFVLFPKIFQHFTIDFHIFGIFFGNFIPHHAHTYYYNWNDAPAEIRKKLFSRRSEHVR